MALVKCPECGCDISNDVEICPFCDSRLDKTANISETSIVGDVFQHHSISDETYESVYVSNTKFKYIGIVAIVLACICFILAYTRINNSDYKNYMEKYKECMAGYDENKYSARTNGVLFMGAYNAIADEYKEMADEAMDEIKSYRTNAICFVVIGGIILISGVVLIKKGSEGK